MTNAYCSLFLKNTGDGNVTLVAVGRLPDVIVGVTLICALDKRTSLSGTWFREMPPELSISRISNQQPRVGCLSWKNTSTLVMYAPSSSTFRPSRTMNEYAKQQLYVGLGLAATKST